MTASHHELDLEALEQLSQGAHSAGRDIVAACPGVTGAVVIATCNRFEVYLDTDDALAARTERADIRVDGGLQHATTEIIKLISRQSGVDAVQASSAFTVRRSTEAIRHLFDVAAGLDSMVVGEREIAGQVRRALDTAHAENTTNPRLERLFQRALHTSKAVANNTELSANGRSIVSVALDLAEPSLPQWQRAAALVVGTGAYAGATVAALRSRGVTDIAVYSPSGRAEVFAATHPVTPVTDLLKAVSEADIVLCCSGIGGHRNPATASMSSVEFVLEQAAVAAAREDLADRAGDPEGDEFPLVIVDLALHRDVDPHVADLDSVLLMDLSTIRANAPSVAQAAVDAAQRIIAQATEEHLCTERVRTADSVIVRLVDQVEQARTQRIAHELTTVPRDDASQRDRITRRVHAHAGTLLHHLINDVRTRLNAGTPVDKLLDEVAVAAAIDEILGVYVTQERRAS
ncbi:glutamyl-tRNA reductase [Jonesia quinghaiensis]|uniref:glutamyl-tRNA reductase n=1 Tax=Jonesia quinghaiensis TaxID=262806 RepID=UPI00040DF306|nr:glutamyl-tRNA reductase [Jonesia quinghaiensis]